MTSFKHILALMSLIYLLKMMHLYLIKSLICLTNLVNEVQPLRRMPSRTVEYVESGDVTGPESGGQMHTCYLVWSFEETRIGSLACRSVGFQAVRAACSSRFVCCKNMQRLGCAVPWNSAILRSLSTRRMSGSGSKIEFKQKGRKGVFYFLLSRS